MFEPVPDQHQVARPPDHQPGRRHLSERQAEVVERLVKAAGEEAADRPYGEISVRTIAKRAGVAAATAYTYFSSKDHLLSEVLWRRMEQAAPLVDLSRPLPERVAEAVRTMGFGNLDNPDLVSSCTTAMLGDGPDVKAVRDRIGREIALRLRAALGPQADPRMLRVLQITYTGAILSAGMGHLAFEDLPDRLAEAAALMDRGDA